MKISDKYLAFSFEMDMKAICQPLFDSTEIISLDYSRLYYDGTHIFLTTQNELVKYTLTKEYEIIPAVDAKIVSNKFSYFESSLLAPSHWQQVIYDYRNFFNVDHALVIIERQLDYVEAFYFYAKPDNHQILNCHLNFFHIINDFIWYFRDRSLPLVKRLHNKRIMLPEHMYKPFLCSFAPNTKSHNLTSKFVHNRYRFCIDSKQVVITKRELDCLRHFCLGYTFKQIAEILYLSPRTVEYYLNNARIKLNVTNKASIIKLLTTHQLLT